MLRNSEAKLASFYKTSFMKQEKLKKSFRWKVFLISRKKLLISEQATAQRANVTVTLTEAELASFCKTSFTKQDKKPEAACTKDYYEFYSHNGT